MVVGSFLSLKRGEFVNERTEVRLFRENEYLGSIFEVLGERFIFVIVLNYYKRFIKLTMLRFFFI